MPNVETERKYVIAMPDIEKISKIEGYTKSEILQIYLASEPNLTHRVRRRAYHDRMVYTENTKLRIDRISCIEDEHEISEDEFLRLSQNIRKGASPLSKTRHTFDFCGLTVEIDVYPAWKSTAIMEIELPSSDTEPQIPDFINIIREVSGMKEYSNSSMATAFPPELHL
jgi:CYTH domain-containing protein